MNLNDLVNSYPVITNIISYFNSLETIQDE